MYCPTSAQLVHIYIALHVCVSDDSEVRTTCQSLSPKCQCYSSVQLTHIGYSSFLFFTLPGTSVKTIRCVFCFTFVL